MSFLGRILVNALVVVGGSYLLPGVEFTGNVFTLIMLALVIALLNTVGKAVLIILTIPVTIITLGLFLLAINAILILIADSLFASFAVDGFLWAFIFGLILSVVTSIFEKREKKYRERR